MTYNVFSGTLNPTQSISYAPAILKAFLFDLWQMLIFDNRSNIR